MFRTLLGALRRAATRLADPTHAELLRTRRELAAAQEAHRQTCAVLLSAGLEIRELRARCEAAVAEGDALDAEMTSLRAALSVACEKRDEAQSLLRIAHIHGEGLVAQRDEARRLVMAHKDARASQCRRISKALNQLGEDHGSTGHSGAKGLCIACCAAGWLRGDFDESPDGPGLVTERP